MQLGSWNKKPVSMRLRQSTLDLLDGLVAKDKGDRWRGGIRNRTHAVEAAVVALAAAKGVKAAPLKPAARRR